MSATTNLQIPLFDGTEETPILDWALTINGEEDTSMAQIIDKAYGRVLNRAIYAEEQPEGQEEGDVWYEVLKPVE